METPLAIYRIVHIKLLTHTKTHTHIYIYKSVCVFLCVCVCVCTRMGVTKATNYEPLICVLYTTYLLLSLTLTNIPNFLPTPLHQIRLHDHLLKVVKLNDSYSASEGGGLDFQTMKRQKFMCSTSMHCANISTYTVKQ